MSLRLRLVVAVGAVALLALLAADVATYRALNSFLYSRLDSSLLSAEAPIEARLLAPGHIGPPSILVDPDRDGDIPLDTVNSGDTFVQLRLPGGEVRTIQKAVERGGKQVVPKLPNPVPGLDGRGRHGRDGTEAFFTASASDGGSMRVLAVTLNSGYRLVLAAPLDEEQATLRRLAAVELAVTVAALAGALLLGWWSVRVGLRPLVAMERTAELIAEGDLAQRVPDDERRSEVGRLARTLNVMLGKIESAFGERDATEAELRHSEERLRRFVADASHELRTPLAAVSAYAELFERGASTKPGDLARVMLGIRAETSRMGHLVEDLLLLARLDEGLPLGRERIDLTAVVAEAVDAASTVGPPWPVELDDPGPLWVVGDGLRLRQVVDNLLSNTRSHTPPGTAVHVRVYQDGGVGDVITEVSDDGPGLGPGGAGRVFQRFYRSDPSRSRSRGGSGLGLSIAAAIVSAHGGTIGADAAPSGGARFTVRLPAAAMFPAAAEPLQASRPDLEPSHSTIAGNRGK